MKKVKKELALDYIKQLKGRNKSILETKLSTRSRINTELSTLQLEGIQTLILLDRLPVNESILQKLEAMFVNGVENFMGKNIKFTEKRKSSRGAINFMNENTEFVERRSGEDRRKIHTVLEPDKERRKPENRRVTDLVEKQIEKMEINDGDFLVIRFRKFKPALTNTIKSLSRYIRKKKAFVIFADYNVKVENFDTEKMNKLGWYRKDQMSDEDERHSIAK